MEEEEEPVVNEDCCWWKRKPSTDAGVEVDVVEEKESGKGGPFYGLRTQVSHAPASTPERAMTWRLPV